MSWGANPQDFTQEPKKVFVNFLIFNLKEIEAQIYFNKNVSGSVKSLRGLIGSLDEKSQEKLAEQLKRLIEFSDGAFYTSLDIEKIYSEVCAYLHGSYLKEVNFAYPTRPSKVKMGVPTE